MRVMRRLSWVPILAAWLACGGAPPEPRTADGPTAPRAIASACPADDATELEPGIAFRETIREGRRLWLYVPCDRAPRALVVVPPAGSNLITGMSLSEGDRPEHLPYARAGFAVASFDIAGPLESDEPEAFYEAILAFMRDQAGLLGTNAAIDWALEEVPSLDTHRIYAAGHSSAATLVLLMGAVEVRVRAVVAYAPVTDLEARFAEVIPEIQTVIPRFGDFVRLISPMRHPSELSQMPVFLFHALDDEVASPQESEALYRAMDPRDAHTVHVTTRGDHYQPMIEEGIARAIEWLQSLP